MQKLTSIAIGLVVVMVVGSMAAFFVQPAEESPVVEEVVEKSKEVVEEAVEKTEEEPVEEVIEVEEEAIVVEKIEEPVEEVEEEIVYTPAQLREMRQAVGVYVEGEDMEQAMQLYETLAAVDPTNPPFFEKAVSYYLITEKDHESAKSLALKIAQANPQSAVAKNLLGWSMVAGGEYEMAREVLAAGLTLDANNAALYLNLGDVYQGLGNLPLASEHYARAIDLDKFGAVGKLAKSQLDNLNE